MAFENLKRELTDNPIGRKAWMTYGVTLFLFYGLGYLVHPAVPAVLIFALCCFDN